MAELHSFGRRAGATALRALLNDIRARANASLSAYQDAHPEPDADLHDARDYGTLATLARGAMLRALQHDDPAFRDGFSLALADLLSIVGDGCCPGDGWVSEIPTTWPWRSAASGEEARNG